MIKKRFLNIRYFYLFLIVLSSYSISCRLDVPIKEMSLARMSILKAYEVKADKYAPKELKMAEKHLFQSHKYIFAEEIDKANDEAKKARESADFAISLSLPPYTKELMDQANRIYVEADLAFAEKYAIEELKVAERNLIQAERMISNEELYESIPILKQAIYYSAEAKRKALSNIDQLKKKASEILKEVERLKSLGAMEFAPQEIEMIDSNLKDADASLDKNNLKDAFKKISKSEEDLKIAALKTMMYLAEKSLKEAEAALQNAEKSEAKEYFIKDIEDAAMLITESKDMYNNKLYEKSNSKSKEAIDLLQSIAVPMKKKADELSLERKREEQRKRDAEKAKIVKSQKEGEAIPKEYTVTLNPKKRDCLWRIALNIYKNARLWPLIYVANRDKIKDPDLIFPGQKLVIPQIPAREEEEDEDVEYERDDDAIKEEAASSVDDAKDEDKEKEEKISKEEETSESSDALITSETKEIPEASQKDKSKGASESNADTKTLKSFETLKKGDTEMETSKGDEEEKDAEKSEKIESPDIDQQNKKKTEEEFETSEADEADEEGETSLKEDEEMVDEEENDDEED